MKKRIQLKRKTIKKKKNQKKGGIFTKKVQNCYGVGGPPYMSKSRPNNPRLLSIGSLRNDDVDDNENGKKAIS